MGITKDDQRFLQEASLQEDGFSSKTCAINTLVDEMPKVVQEDYFIKDRYNIDTVVLLNVNVDTMFVYWEITEKLLREYNIDNLDFILKLYDINTQETLHETSIVSDVGSYYINKYIPKREVVCAIGVYRDGKFIQILISNKIKTPNDIITECDDEVWMIKNREWMEIIRRSMHVSVPLSSSSIVHEIEMLKKYSEEMLDLSSSHTTATKG